MFTAYSLIQKYYVANIHNQDEEARAAYEYASERWGIDLVEESGIGYAYDSWDGLQNSFYKQIMLIKFVYIKLFE